METASGSLEMSSILVLGSSINRKDRGISSLPYPSITGMLKTDTSMARVSNCSITAIDMTVFILTGSRKGLGPMRGVMGRSTKGSLRTD
jgi:hypothetical protein